MYFYYVNINHNNVNNNEIFCTKGLITFWSFGNMQKNLRINKYYDITYFQLKCFQKKKKRMVKQPHHFESSLHTRIYLNY